MPVPGSGELSLLKIAKEKVHDDYTSGSSITGAISLTDVSTSGNSNGSGESFDITNTESPNFPDGNVSHGMTEFYAYDHTHTPVACNQAMDVVFVIDYTGSMADEFTASSTGLQAQVTNITNKIVSRSGGDYRLTMVLVDAKSGSSTSGLNYSSSSTYTSLPSANKHVQQIGSGTPSRHIHSTALVKFASTNNTNFANKLNLLAAGDNNSGNMQIGSGQNTIGWEVALDQILNNNFAGTFRSGVNRMIIFVTDTSPEGTATGQFTGAEETTLMGSLSNTAVANNTSISIIGPINNQNSNDGTTNTHTIYNGYADNTGGLTDFTSPLDSADIVTFIENICDDVETNFATVVTVAESSITSSGFTMNGNITAQGGSSITTRGFVRAQLPTNLYIGESGVTNTTAGSGTGTFSSAVTGLSANTTYYYRAYAINSTGTSYGAVETATTASVSLTSFSASTSQTFSGVCSASANQTYYHNGSLARPVVNDNVYTTNGTSNPLGAGYYRFDNLVNQFFRVVGVAGQVSQVDDCGELGGP